MGTIQTAFNNVTFKVSEGIDNIQSSVSTVFENIVGTVQATAAGLYAGDVVGIDINQIETMQAAIQTYVEDLNTHLSEMEANASTDQAYKGNYAEAVSGFIASVKACCYAIISQLLAFSDQLTEIKASYEENDTTLSGDISSQADELKGSYSEYSSGSGN